MAATPIREIAQGDTLLHVVPEPLGDTYFQLAVVIVDMVATLRVKAVVLVRPPPVEVTVIGNLPAGVDPVVAMVSAEEQVRLQEAKEKDPVASEGRPETEKETA